MAFSSQASNLVGEDTAICEDPIIGPHNCYDVFLHDRQTGTTTLVSATADGLPAGGDSFVADISTDGRIVLFSSDAGALALGGPDTCPSYAGSNCPDLYVYDQETGEIEQISLAHDGAVANGASSGGVLSADGRTVAFSSDASNLVPDGDTDGLLDVFIYDRELNKLDRIE